MSAYAHGPHPESRDDDGRPVLFDGCRACLDHAEKKGLGLDRARFEQAWEVMLAAEYGYPDGYGHPYRSDNEAKLGRNLYEVALVLQRHFGLDPRMMVVTP